MSVVLLPEPRETETASGRVSLQGASVVLGAGPDRLEQEAAALISAALPAPGTNEGGVSIRIGAAASELELPSHPEGYVLRVDGAGVAIRGGSPRGTWYGAQTLLQLVTGQGPRLDHLTIRDWPELDHRGLFVESKWGPDLMDLEDWKRLVDYCAELKFNHLGIGVYGCWVIQYDDAITEFLMVPLPDLPDAATPKRIEYHSPARDRVHEVSYLPRMFERDFFGDLVGYGRSRGVTVRPQFNSMGHNTLIPRLVPAVSVKDAEGKATGYGYCLSSPATDELIFRLYDRIIDDYLLPNDVRSFHLGLDEVWSTVGIYSDDPHRRVEPWCRCPRCRERTPEELFEDWVFRLCGHLADRGMEEIGVWTDQLDQRMHLLDERLARKLRESGLAEKLTLEWWEYGPTVRHTDLHPGLGLQRWVVPMAGYYHWLPYQSYLENIHSMLALARVQGATGVESYCTYDPAFDRNYRYLSQLAWNPVAVESIDAFRETYARGLPGASADTLAAMRAFDAAVVEGDTADLLRVLTPYRYTYVSADLPYPRHYPSESLDALVKDREGNRRRLTELARCASDARIRLLGLSASCRQTRELAVEAERIEAVASTFLTLLEIEDELARSGGSEARPFAAGRVRSALLRWDSMMAAVEAVKEPYLIPQLMRELTTLRAYLVRLLDALETGRAGGADLLRAVALRGAEGGTPTAPPEAAGSIHAAGSSRV